MLADLRAAHKKAGDLDEAMERLAKIPTLGFWDKPGIRTIDNFVGVVTPKDCPEDQVYPKEQRLIDICIKQKKDGRQTWVYVQMTGKRNIQPRLKSLLEAEGLKVGVLWSDDVEPIDREEWITAKQVRDFDVHDLPPPARQHGPRPVQQETGRTTTTRPSSSTRLGTTSSPCGKPPAGPGGSASPSTAGSTTSTTRRPCSTRR